MVPEEELAELMETGEETDSGDLAMQLYGSRFGGADGEDCTVLDEPGPEIEEAFETDEEKTYRVPQDDYWKAHEKVVRYETPVLIPSVLPQYVSPVFAHPVARSLN